MEWPKQIKLITAPNKILNTRCKSLGIENIPNHIIEQMFEIMEENNGVGLAAPQVGLPYRFFVMKNQTGHNFTFRNPIINRISNETGVEEEGCLSIPGIILPVRRPFEIWVSQGAVDVRFEGIDARVFLHEYDHLDGILFTRRFAELFEL